METEGAVVQITLKKPITTTSSFSANVLASSTVFSSTAGGPVFFFSQLTMSEAWRPAACEHDMYSTASSWVQDSDKTYALANISSANPLL